jgi:chromosome condensin MukBEF complex kleisin-like MukF subunit
MFKKKHSLSNRLRQIIANIKAMLTEISDIIRSHLDTWNIDELVTDLKSNLKCIESLGLGSIYNLACYYYWHYFISNNCVSTHL